MKTLRFLLINPTSQHWRAVQPSTIRRPRVFGFSMLTSLYVAAAMPTEVQTTIVDEEVEPVDLDADADLVGISFMTFNAPRAYEIAATFRARSKPVIFGGYHPTFMADEAVQHADAVVVGEAEGSLPRLVEDFQRGLPTKSVPT